MQTRIKWAMVQAAFFLLTGRPALCSAADPSTLTVVEAFFSPQGIVDKSHVYKGEMLRFTDKPTMGEYLGPDASKEYRLLSQSRDTCVYGIAVKIKGATQDWYAFVESENRSWKLSAVRTLAQTGLIAANVAVLSRKTPRSPDEDWQLKNSQLTLSSDSDLKKYLISNRTRFDSLAESLRDGTNVLNRSTVMRELLLLDTKLENSGMIRFTIGGILDNAVGYLWLPDKMLPPPMEPGNYIYVEHIVDHWYIFKTT